MKTDWPGVKTDSYLMFFNPWTQHLLGVINPMPTMRLKKINNSSQQAGACHANPGEVHLILKNSGVIGTVRTSPNVVAHYKNELP